MIVQGVNFNEEYARGVGVEEFVSHFAGIVYLELAESDRIKLLQDVYKKINPTKKRKEGED